MFVTESADFSGDLEIGADSNVWHLAQARADPRLASTCMISRSAYTGSTVVLGDLCNEQECALLDEPAFVQPVIFIGTRVVRTICRFRCLEAEIEAGRKPSFYPSKGPLSNSRVSGRPYSHCLGAPTRPWRTLLALAELGAGNRRCFWAMQHHLTATGCDTVVPRWRPPAIRERDKTSQGGLSEQT